MGLPITERSANEMSGTDLFYTVVRDAGGEYGDPYYIRLASLVAYFNAQGISGNVTGPDTSTDNAVARFSGVAGELIQDSGWVLDDDDYLYADGRIGIGPGASPPLYPLHISDLNIDTDATFYLAYLEGNKTAGATTHFRSLYGLRLVMGLDQVGGVIAHYYGFRIDNDIANGDIGSVGIPRDFYGTHNLSAVAGNVFRDEFGDYTALYPQAPSTVAGDVLTHYVLIDSDATVSGNVYGYYLYEGAGVDYGYYQDGTAPNIFGGPVTMDDLNLYDTNASHTLLFHWNEDEAAANRTLNVIMAGADRTLDFTTATLHDELHNTAHENGGGDEISVAALSGELADPQKQKVQDFRFGTEARAYYRISSSVAYQTISSVIFPGSTIMGTPASMKTVAWMDAGAGTVDVRIYDSTNGLQIAELVGIVDVVPTIQDLGAIANIPANQAIFDVQVQTSGGAVRIGIAAFEMRY